MDNYEKIVRDNLDKLYQNLPDDLDRLLPGRRRNDQFYLKAFGKSCRIRPDGIFIGDDLWRFYHYRPAFAKNKAALHILSG